MKGLSKFSLKVVVVIFLLCSYFLISSCKDDSSDNIMSNVHSHKTENGQKSFDWAQDIRLANYQIEKFISSNHPNDKEIRRNILSSIAYFRRTMINLPEVDEREDVSLTFPDFSNGVNIDEPRFLIVQGSDKDLQNKISSTLTQLIEYYRANFPSYSTKNKGACKRSLSVISGLEKKVVFWGGDKSGEALNANHAALFAKFGIADVGVRDISEFNLLISSRATREEEFWILHDKVLKFYDTLSVGVHIFDVNFDSRISQTNWRPHGILNPYYFSDREYSNIVHMSKVGAGSVLMSLDEQDLPMAVWDDVAIANRLEEFREGMNGFLILSEKEVQRAICFISSKIDEDIYSIKLAECIQRSRGYPNISLPVDPYFLDAKITTFNDPIYSVKKMDDFEKIVVCE